MGVQATHYGMYGIVVDDKVKVKELFRKEEHYEVLLNDYDDNGYREEISPTESGFHAIVDGMNGGYFVIGEILFKSLDGLPAGLLLRGDALKPKPKNKKKLLEVIQTLENDLQLGLNELKPEFVIFTHYH